MTDTPSSSVVSELVQRSRSGFEKIDVSDELREAASASLERWLSEDEFEDARPQLVHLIETGQHPVVFDAFFRQIPFGTGGRRGPVGYGTNRINRFTIATSIAGHSRFLAERFPDVDGLAVVVAYDVRVFRDLRGVYAPDIANPILGSTSIAFAKVAAEVYAAHGIRVWMPDPDAGVFISTPELSFAIRHLAAQGGLNVSASHNHPDDNGAKIYNDRGSQEIPPVDEQLAKIVEATVEAPTMPFDEAVKAGLVQWLPDSCYEAYLAANDPVTRDPAARGARVVFTPLHGTGFHSAGAVLERAGFDVELYPEQAEPDGVFPNVPFRSPNPEVRESLEGAAEHARKLGADLVLGTDPDADRIGMMAPHAGEWRFFTGNEVGLILVQYLLSGGGARPEGARPFATTTVVTTSLFGKICRAYGVEVVDDLGVGFKYIADILNGIESTGQWGDLRGAITDFTIGIEESHGYLVIPDVRDKDAAGAALLLAELASKLKEDGRSFVDYLDDVYRQHGYVRNFLVSTVMQGAQGFVNMRDIQESLRQEQPPHIGGREVVEFVDRWDESGPLGSIVSETDRASRDLLTFVLGGGDEAVGSGARLTLRPSGTEPKNKIYVEVCGEPLGVDASAEDLARERERVDGEARRLGREFTKVMLARIDVQVPDYALEVSDLVSLENKRDFAASFLPELLPELARTESDADLVKWIDVRLAPYGSDPRLLVRHAVDAYVAAEAVDADTASRLKRLFSGGDVAS